MDKSKLGLIGIAAAAVLFVSVNIIARGWLSSARLDVTEGGAFSLSDQVRPVFEGIEEPIVVRVYYTESLGAASPRHAAYYQRVRDLLGQFGSIAGARLKIEYYSPEPFSDVEDRAVGFGLQAVPLGQGGEVGYFGLAATNSTDDQQIIPFFNIEREQFLEYDLTKLIYALAKPVQPKIGLISSLPLEGGMSGGQFGMGGQPTPPWVIMDQIKELFDVENLDAQMTEVPKEIGILMLAQPEGLSETAQYAIDQFVLGGGKVLAFVDPNAESANQMAPGAGGSLEGIKKLMSAWGVTLAEGKIVGDIDSATRVNTESGGRPIISEYVAWLGLGKESLDASDAITGDLNLLNLATAGALDKVEGASTTVTPLIQTGLRSMRIDTDKVMGLPDVVALFRDFQPADKREILAARISGKAKTAFPDGSPTTGEPAATPEGVTPPEKPAHLSEAKDSIQVVIVADADMLSERFWAQTSNFLGRQVLVPTADNPAFLLNAIGNLTGSPALAGLRGRGAQRRTFELIEDIQLEAEREYRASEQALLTRLDDLQKKVNEIQLKQPEGEEAMLSAEDTTAIENYRGEIISTRRELRDVQRALREDIDRIESTLKFINIAGVPLVFGGILIVLAVSRARRRAAST